MWHNGRHHHGHENRPTGAAAGLIRAILNGTFRAEIGCSAKDYSMFVVVWEPKRGTGGGHQLVMDKQKAERISRVMYRALPDAEIRVMTAAEHAAAAVTEQQQRRVSRR
jgi:hypothetical protein